jgi:hypothetical protein
MGYHPRRMRALMMSVVAMVTVFCVERAYAEPRRVLTLRTADRAIDLAWQAELAGDAKSARVELTKLIETATRSDESAAKERLGEWLRSIDQRETSFQGMGKTARGYHAAFLTLQNFGLHRATQLWERAGKDLPMLASRTSSTTFHVDVDIVQAPQQGIDRAFVEKTIKDVLEKYGVHTVERRIPAKYDARVSLDATDVGDQARLVRVTAGASMVVRERNVKPQQSRVVASISKHRAETRRNAADARRIASKLSLDETTEAIVFQLRAQWLDELAQRESNKI